MENFQVIELNRQRDFSRKMNATFEFIKQNIGPLTKSILIIAGPPVLIGSLFLGSFFGELFGLSSMAATNPTGLQDFMRGTEFWMNLLFMCVFLIVSFVVTISTVNNYLMLYMEKRSNKIEVSEVWDRVRNTLGMYIGTTFLFVLLTIVAYIVMIIPAAILGAISPWLIFFGVILFFVGIMYFTVSVSLVYIIRSNEKIGFFEAIIRSYKLVQNKWWSTFGLIMILYIIMIIISYLFLIPFYVFTFVNALHSVETGTFTSPTESMGIWVTVFFAFYYLLQILLATLPNVGIAFQYFNLVELKEAKGLMSEIQTLGNQQETNRPEEHF